MTRELAARALILLTALIFGALGIACVVAPGALMETVQVEASTPVAKAEIMAMYGGLQLGLAAFLGLCARRDPRLGLWLVALSLGGLGAMRLVGLLRYGGEWSLLGWFLLSELSGAVAAAVLLGMGGEKARQNAA